MEMEAAMQSCRGCSAANHGQLQLLTSTIAINHIHYHLYHKKKPDQDSRVPMPFLWARIKFRLQLTPVEKNTAYMYKKNALVVEFI
jgi:hypothetical protein